MTSPRIFIGLFSLLAACPASAQTIELVNNQPFDIRMPVRLRGLKLDANPAGPVGPAGPAGNAPLAQQAGDDVVFMADVPASQSRQIENAAAASDPTAASPVAVKSEGPGVAFAVAGREMGRLAWGVVVAPAPTEMKEGEQAPSTKRDFAGSFQPVELKFEQTGQGPLFNTWAASGMGAGLKLDVELHAYRTGFLDVRATVTNDSAPTADVYAALVCRWDQPEVAGRTLCYDNRRQEFGDGDSTSFRSGDGRHLYIQRGVDWINTRLADGTGVVWMNDFTPSFTYHRENVVDSKGKKLPARWVGANSAHLGQEAQSHGGALYSVTEIARPNRKAYDPRIETNILPEKGQDPLTIVSRLVFDTKSPVSDDAADQRFVAYAGYNPQDVSPGGAKLTFGVPFTRMGTNYFPYSTLGENFGDLRMEGMSKEGYWPLAPQTVLQWEKFADDVRRDLRILKAMGFERCRLHHLEVLWDIDPATDKPYVPVEKRWEYLDFLFGEIEKLGLKALLDVKLPAADVAELVKRYGRLCEGVEYDNEILIFQIFDEDVPVWKEVRDAVKQVDPNMPFFLTAHTNMGVFDRLEKLGVKVDRVGQHAYLDGVEPIASSRDYALAAGNYAAKVGKEPAITEWNWRFLTRMTFDDRAKVYPPIFENVLAARCMPTVYQFQFQDSLAMNPTTLKGIRRYEPLLLSRRPKPEGLALMTLAHRYGDPSAASNVLATGYQAVDFSELKTAKPIIKVSVTNRSAADQIVSASAEAPEAVEAGIRGASRYTLKPGQTATVGLEVCLKDGAKALPGFYHTFVRFEREDGSSSYAWVELRNPGPLTLDKTPGDGKVAYAEGALDFDFNRPLTVVYPDEASTMELESAWTVFITLESATGRPVEIYQQSDLDKADAANRTVVFVTRDKDAAKPSVQAEGKRLVISGATQEDVSAACMDFVVRYWKNAQDAGARKVGLVAAPAGGAGVKTDLD